MPVGLSKPGVIFLFLRSKGYLLYITKEYGGAAFQQFGLGGPLLSANAGGFIAKRSVHDWLYGEFSTEDLSSK